MKKLIFYIPLILFTVFYGLIAISDVGDISPFVFGWIGLFFISGFMLHKRIFWGSIFGILPAMHLIYMGTQDTGQIINEIPLGIIVLIFYFLCGAVVYKNNK